MLTLVEGREDLCTLFKGYEKEIKEKKAINQETLRAQKLSDGKGSEIFKTFPQKDFDWESILENDRRVRIRTGEVLYYLTMFWQVRYSED